jgi:hypothetical protein
MYILGIRTIQTSPNTPTIISEIAIDRSIELKWLSNSFPVLSLRYFDKCEAILNQKFYTSDISEERKGVMINNINGLSETQNYEISFYCIFDYPDGLKETDILKFSGQTGITLSTLELLEVTSLEVTAKWPTVRLFKL